MPTLQQLIKKHKFDWVNPDITESNFPPEEISTNPTKLYHLDRNISSDEVVKEMARDGYRPANAYELLNWEAWNGEDYVVALGSFARIYGSRHVLCLYRYGSGRDLRLDWLDDDWFGGCRFLAVATSSDPKPLDPSLDLKSLELRVSVIENWITSFKQN